MYSTLIGTKIRCTQQEPPGMGTMERKGFKVTKDVGCLLPHSQYGKSITGSGAKMNGCGYKTSMGFFGLIGNHPSAPERDTDGRPISLEVSHLCHRSSCINPIYPVAGVNGVT